MTMESDTLAKTVMDVLENSEERILEAAAVIGVVTEMAKQVNAKVDIRDLIGQIGVFAKDNLTPAYNAISAAMKAEQTAEVKHWTELYLMAYRAISAVEHGATAASAAALAIIQSQMSNSTKTLDAIGNVFKRQPGKSES